MRLPIRNKRNQTLTIFVEPHCDEFEVPIGGEAIVRLEDGPPHSIDISETQVTIWDEGLDGTVEILAESDKRVDKALMLASMWLHRLGGESEAALIRKTVDDLETEVGYLGARLQVFGAFYDGFRNENAGSSMGDMPLNKRQSEALAACYGAGRTAARLNGTARDNNVFPEFSAAPFDTDTIRLAFERALADVPNCPTVIGRSAV